MTSTRSSGTTISFNDSQVTISASSDTRLVELSFALEFASNNFCGRGVYRWDVERRPGNGVMLVNVLSLMPDLNNPRPLQISQVAQLGGAVQQKVIPLTIPERESFRFDRLQPKLAQDGQNRRRKLFSFTASESDWTETIIEANDLDPRQTLATYSYGFADMTVGLFALGVQHIKYQISRNMTQLYIRHRLSDERLIQYFKAEGNDYDINSTVGKLP